MRLALAAALLFLGLAVPADAEWQIKPFVGAKFGTTTTFPDTDLAIGKKKIAFGVNGALIGEIVGVEADFGRFNRFFESRIGGAVLKSSVTTFTGNVMIALPRHLTEYTLRPYFVGGAGVMSVRNDQVNSLFDFSRDIPAMDVGGGVTGFLTHRIGLNWELRHFRTLRGQVTAIISPDEPEQLSFWRANMALAIRY